MQKIFLTAALAAALAWPLTAKDEGKTISAEAIPAKVTAADLDGTRPEFLAKYFILTVFPQKMQLADGKLSENEGKVLVMQKDSSMIIAFYRPEGGEFVLVGKPTVLSAVVPPRADVHPENGLPCVVVRRQGSADAWRLFLRAGKVVSEQFVDETAAKAGK